MATEYSGGSQGQDKTPSSVGGPGEGVRGGGGTPSPGDDFEVINFVRACRNQSEDAREERASLNSENMAAYLNRQDWSHKLKGQSKEFLPKIAVSVEQFVSFVKKAITQFGDWYSIEALDPDLPFSSAAAEALLNNLSRNVDGQNTALQTVFGDGIRCGVLEALMIFKVHGRMYEHVEHSSSGKYKKDAWRLQIDLIPFQDYYPDPTGRGLYEIQRSTRDLCDVIRDAEEGKYDIDVVNKIMTDAKRPEDEERPDWDRASSPITGFEERKEVFIDEFWGSILDKDGRVVASNVFCAIANDCYLIRKPKPNPFWHGESPFVVFPLIRVPHSVFHRALYDAGTRINLVLNELINLMIDGGMASVWGINQIRVGDLYDDSQISEGIPQGTTLQVKSSLPPGAKVFEQVSTGKLPPDALALFEALSREYAGATMTNELKMGQFPGHSVKATEVIEMSQSQSTLMDGVAMEIEAGLAVLMQRAWLVTLQHIDKIPYRQLVVAMGPEGAIRAKNVSPKDLFAAYGYGAAFKVEGISSQISRARDFQRLVGLLQVIQANPLLLQAFFSKISVDSLLARLFKLLNLDIMDFQRTANEEGKRSDELMGMQQFAQMLGGGSPSSAGGPNPGGVPPGADAGMMADINSMANPNAVAMGGSE